jgi:hypothetical protein
MAFKLSFVHYDDLCDRCNKKGTDVNMTFTSKSKAERQYIGLCFDCLGYVARKAGRCQIVRKDPQAFHVTDEDRKKYLPSA